jgi:hypothetical protein
MPMTPKRTGWSFTPVIVGHDTFASMEPALAGKIALVAGATRGAVRALVAHIDDEQGV